MPGVAQGLLLSLRSSSDLRKRESEIILILFVVYLVERVKKSIRWGAAALAW